MKIRSTNTLAKAIHEATRDKSGAGLTTVQDSVVAFMKKNQLMSRSKEILSQLEKIIDKENNVVRVKVKSADILSKDTLKDLEENLKKRYQANKVEIDNIKDESVINGIKIEALDEVIDLSLSHRLSQLQAHLIKN